MNLSGIAVAYTVEKYHFVASFPYFNGTAVLYTFVSVNRRNTEAPAHIQRAWARASSFRRFTDRNANGTGSVKLWKTGHKMSVDIRIFFTA